MIPATCSTCGMTTNCPDELAGKTMPCSGCGTNLTVGAAGAALGGYGGYGGYGGAQPQAKAKASSSGSPWFLKWWVLTIGGVAAIGGVAGLVYLVSPKGKQQEVAQAEEPANDSKPAAKVEEKPAEEMAKGSGEKPAKTKGLVLSPIDEISVEAGGTAKVTIKVDRGGAKGPIPLSLENLPDQVTAEPVEIAEGKDSAELVLKVAEEAKPGEPAKFKIMAELGESQAELEVAVVIKPPPPPVLSTVAALTLRPRGTAVLEVKVDRKGYNEPINLAFEALPEKVTVSKAVGPAAATPASIPADSQAAGDGDDPAAKEFTIPAEESSLKITLTAAADVAEGISAPRVTTTVREQKLETPLKLTIERFAYRVRPLPVVTLKPGESKTIEVIVERRSYKGAVKLAPTGLPEKVKANTIELAENATKAELKVSAEADAAEGVASASLTTKANNEAAAVGLVVRIAKSQGSFLPAAVAGEPDSSRPVKRNTIAARLDANARQALLKAYGGTAESEAAVLKGLAWLAKQQNEQTGQWSLTESGTSSTPATGQGDGGDAAVGVGTASGGGAATDRGVLATALGVLPFLGAGVTHEQSPSEPAVLKEYRPKVFKALGGMAQQQATFPRDPKKDGELPGGTLAHACGTLAFCEAFALSKDDRLKLPAQRAIKFLVQTQQADGSWAVAPEQPGDVLTMVWVLQALRSGQQAGVAVDKSAFEKAGKFLTACAAGPDGAKQSLYAEKPGGTANLPATAAALLCREYQGWEQENADLLAGCKHLLERAPPQTTCLYACYTTTEALRNLEGENWDQWNHAVRGHLIAAQERDAAAEGSWSPVGTTFGDKFGRLYSTSLALLTLQTYYRQLPLYR